MTARDGHWWAATAILLGCLLLAAAWCLGVTR
jgi:hypothetical protein